MTDQQVVEAFSGEAVELDGAVPEAERTFDGGEIARVGIPETRIGDSAVRVFFLTGQAGLHRVEIQAAETDDENYLRLEALLVEKYGKPWTGRTAETWESQWTLQSTKITLRRTALRSVHLRSLWLTCDHRQPTDNI
jgi:hypothetical protein